MALTYSVFAEKIILISEMVGKKMSDGLLHLYYQSLKNMSDQEFVAAANRIVRERVYTSLPLPADFLGSVDQDGRGILASEELLRIMERVGGDQDLHGVDPVLMMAVEALGGWVACCDTVAQFDLAKLGIWKREFAAVYRAMLHRPESSAPRVLFGRNSQNNIMAGYLNPETGELKSISGMVVKTMPWASRQISQGERKRIATTIEEVSDEEKDMKEVHSIVSEVLDQLGGKK